MCTHIRMAAAAVAVMLLPVCSEAQVVADTLLARLTAEALAANPSLQARRASAHAAAKRVGPAGALPDPMLSVGIMDLTLPRFAFRESDFTEVDLEVSQDFPWPGSLGARSQVARAHARRATAGSFEGPIRKPIDMTVNGNRSGFRIPGVVEMRQTPIKDVVSGNEKEIHIVYPKGGFLWNDGSICTTSEMRIKQGKVVFEHPGRYSAYAVANWTNQQ